jgi:hypothetical protein
VSNETWSEMSRDRPPTGGRPSGVADRVRLRWFAGLMIVTSGTVFLISRGRTQFRCRQECYGKPALEQYGSLTYEPGHAWTRYADSWQWSVQHGLTQLAVIASIVGLALAATSSRNPVPAFGVTALGVTGWIVWVLLSPPIM